MNTPTKLSTRLLRLGLGFGFAFISISGANAATITWTGAAQNTAQSPTKNTFYTVPENWDLGRVPNQADDVIIPANGTAVPTASGTVTVATQPVLDPSLGIGVARNLTVNSSASLSLNLEGTLYLFGNLTNNGTVVGQGTISVRATGTGHTIGGSGSAISIRDLELLPGAGTTTLNIGMSLIRQLTVSDNLAVTSGVTLTLLSTPAVTAYVINNGTAVVSGSVTVQRAIDTSRPGGGTFAGVGYRHYSSPVTNTTVNDLATSTFTPNFNTAYNESSFAPGTRPFPTVQLYDQARVTTDNGYSARFGFSEFDRGWVIPSSGASMLVGRGYTVNLAGTELVDFVGTLNNGPYSVTISRNAAGTPFSDQAGWQFLGNPYPSAIDWSLANLTGTDIADGMYVYISTSQYGGFYRAYAGGSGNPVIPLGQGFFVRKANPGSSTFTFTNALRLGTSNGTTFQRSVADARPQLEMALHSSDKVVQDMLNVHFDNGSTAGVDGGDAVKMPNKNGMFLGTLAADGQELAIDGRPVPTDKLTIPLHVAVATAGTYTIETAKLANMGDLHAYLHDKRLGSFTDLSQQPEYTFNLSPVNPASRFELVFSKQPITEAASAAVTRQVDVYPSPAKGTAFIELPASLGNEAITATLVDALGRTVRTTSLPAQGEATHQFSLEGLRGGIYVLRLNTSAGIVAKRLAVE